VVVDLDRLASHLTIDLTTTGRHSGQPRTVEIWWFRVDDRFVITGTPGRRDWLANVLDDPRVMIHVDGQDLPATVATVTDEVFRRRVFTDPRTSWYSSQAELDRLVASAPMVEVIFDQL
jgi:deazaflavin-dependent oxidoreductase (nitroreductase family)